MRLDFRVVIDEPATTALVDAFENYWPAYMRWMRRADPIDPAEWRGRLRDHMPELVGVHAELCDRFGGGDEIGRFLSLYNPPRIIRACTQLVVDTETGPRLFRTYDHHPKLFDGVILKSTWRGHGVLAVTDCVWGALDGINEHGLCVALAFGGRPEVGAGFAAPLVCRYILETCATVAEAKKALARLPAYMAYTFVVADRAGDFVTAFLGPSAPANFITRRASANHQGHVEWPAYAQFTASEERLAEAESLVQRSNDLPGIREAFVSPPFWRDNYAKASGTLYAAEYAPLDRSLTLHWPGRSETIGLEDAKPALFSVALGRSRPAADGGSDARPESTAAEDATDTPDQLDEIDPPVFPY